MPSPVYQWRKALRRNIAVNCSDILLNNSWMAVELPMKVADILRPLGGMSHTAVLILFGIHSTKYELFLFWIPSICSSTSFIDILPEEDSRHSQITSMPGIACSHHILGVKHLLGQFRNSQCPVLLTASGGEGGEARHEEMQPWEWNHVDSQFPKIGVQLTGEPEAGGNARHSERNKVVQISVGGVGQLQSPEADVVEGFVINAESLVSVLNELVDGQCCVVRFHNGVRHLWAWDDRVRVHDAVRELFPNLGDQQCAHT